MYRLTSADMSRRNILIVEDDLDAAWAILREIEASGGSVAGHARSIAEAITVIAGGAIDQVVIPTRISTAAPFDFVAALRAVDIDVVFTVDDESWFEADESADAMTVDTNAIGVTGAFMAHG